MHHYKYQRAALIIMFSVKRICWDMLKTLLSLFMGSLILIKTLLFCADIQNSIWQITWPIYHPERGCWRFVSIYIFGNTEVSRCCAPQSTYNVSSLSSSETPGRSKRAQRQNRQRLQRSRLTLWKLHFRNSETCLLCYFTASRKCGEFYL